MLNFDAEKYLENNIHPRVLLTPEQTSKLFFKGCRSASSLRRDARCHRLPYLKFGRKIYFDAETLRDFIAKEAADSIRITEDDNGNITALPASVPGIVKINV